MEADTALLLLLFFPQFILVVLSSPFFVFVPLFILAFKDFILGNRRIKFVKYLIILAGD